MEERTELEEELEQIVDEHGAENTLWTLVRTVNTNKLKEIIHNIKWALGEE